MMMMQLIIFSAALQNMLVSVCDLGHFIVKTGDASVCLI